MNPPPTPEAPLVARYWAYWIGITVGGPLIALGYIAGVNSMMFPKKDLTDKVLLGLLWLIFFGILWSSFKIDTLSRWNVFVLSLGGIILSAAIFFAGCVSYL